MKRRLVVHPDVSEDLAGALTRHALAAERFADDYAHALEFIDWYPHGGAVYVDAYRRVNLRAFPWLVGYEVRSEEVWVLALLDARRDPEALRHILRGRG